MELRRQLAVAEADCDAVRAHAVMTGVESAMWKHKFNKKCQKKESLKWLHTEAHILTSREGKKLVAAEVAKKAQKKKAEAEKKKNWKEMETANMLCRTTTQ